MTKKYNPDDYIYESFKTKIYPTKEQKKYFHKCFGISKLAYNWFLYTKENNYRNNIKKIETVAIEPVREKTILTQKQVDECLEKLVELGKYQIACFMALACASGARKRK